MLPFVRPSVTEDDIERIVEVLRSGWITTGPKAQAFEQALSEYLDGALVRVFNSGTSALEASLLACDIGPGDEVIVPAMSFVASANVVLRVGARPIFVDVGLDTRNIDVSAIEAALTPKTKAILPVHFAGLAADLDPLYQVAEDRGLHIIEDAAHAIGAEYHDRRIGAEGDMICFSFHPNKNMTTIEGGAVACFDPDLAKRLERIRFHGIERDEAGQMDVGEWGGKMNMPDVHAVLGLQQLARLDDYNAKRRTLVARYFERLPRHAAVRSPADGDGHSWHIFAPLIDFDALGTDRANFQERLAAHEIGSGFHYPAMHLFKLYRRMGYQEGDFPNAERVGAQTLTLPLFPAMTEADVDRVCDAIASVLSDLSGGNGS